MRIWAVVNDRLSSTMIEMLEGVPGSGKSYHAVAEKFGAWREKNMYGKKTIGIARSTFILDGTGTIFKVWKAVKVDGHDEHVLAALKELVAG